jgi:ACS family D-galactonate transporter-like MFS transporter
MNPTYPPRALDTQAAAYASSPVHTRARFGILAVLAIGTTINYPHRSVAGIAAPAMRSRSSRP